MRTRIITLISITLLIGCKPSTPQLEDNYSVHIKAEGVYVRTGDFAKVHITSADHYDLYGVVV